MSMDRVHFDLDRFYSILCGLCNMILNRLGDGFDLEIDLSDAFFSSINVEKSKLDAVVNDLRSHLQLDVMSLTNVKNTYFNELVGCSDLLRTFLTK